MPRKKRTIDKELSSREIARFVRLLRKLLQIHDQKAQNLLVVFEKLRKIFPKLRLRIVADSDLPEAEARAYPEAWIIKIRRGIYEGLKRGDAGARWTFAHELGHVLFQHPGKPFRMRSDASLDVVEQQAHKFAAHFLVPSELAKRFKSAEEIASAFQISIDAARRRFLELKSEKMGARLSLQRETEDLFVEDQATRICSAISSTLSESQAPVEVWRDSVFSASLLMGTGAQLLLDAYESVRPNSKSNFISAACVALSVFSLGPIREIGAENSASETVQKLNQCCALRSAGALLNLRVPDLSETFSAGSKYPGDMLFTIDYLKPLMEFGKDRIKDSSAVLRPKQLPSCYEYNGDYDVSWSEIKAIEALSVIFALWAERTRT
ncbi:MAG: ImmA/IrrE family metallo-endopeptidase [bacterium]|nr:ImmA/IrrE family metallo-endopeptidase [bacterium]